MEPIIETNVIRNSPVIRSPLQYVAIGTIILSGGLFFAVYLIVTPGMVESLLKSRIGWILGVAGIMGFSYAIFFGVRLLFGGLKDAKSEPVSTESVVSKAGWNFKHMNYQIRLENGQAFIVSKVIAKRLRPGYRVLVRYTPFLHILLEARIVSAQ